MITIHKLALGGLACAILSAIPACETAPAGHPPGRALQSPVERNSTSGEMANLSNAEGITIVEVGFPNNRNQSPTVRTIVDNFAHPPTEASSTPSAVTPATVGVTVGTPTTQPHPPATQPGVIIDPLLGPHD